MTYECGSREPRVSCGIRTEKLVPRAWLGSTSYQPSDRTWCPPGMARLSEQHLPPTCRAVGSQNFFKRRGHSRGPADQSSSDHGECLPSPEKLVRNVAGYAVDGDRKVLRLNRRSPDAPNVGDVRGGHRPQFLPQDRRQLTLQRRSQVVHDDRQGQDAPIVQPPVRSLAQGLWLRHHVVLHVIVGWGLTIWCHWPLLGRGSAFKPMHTDHRPGARDVDVCTGVHPRRLSPVARGKKKTRDICLIAPRTEQCSLGWREARRGARGPRRRFWCRVDANSQLLRVVPRATARVLIVALTRTFHLFGT